MQNMIHDVLVKFELCLENLRNTLYVVGFASRFERSVVNIMVI